MSRSVIVVGANGRLGRRLVRELRAAGIAVMPVARSLLNLETDLRDTSEILAHVEPLAVINVAAMNGLEECEADPTKALIVNSVAPLALARFAASRKVPFLHFSSDYVLSGKMSTPDWKPYDESHEPAPHLTYGMSKLSGERTLALSNGWNYIFRLSSIYSTDDFAGSLGPVRAFRRGEEIRVLKQFTTSTSVGLIARSVVVALEKVLQEGFRAQTELFHLAARDAQWKATFAGRAIELFCGEPPLPAEAIGEGQLALPRPQFSALDPSKFEKRFGVQLPTVLEDLEEEARLWRESGREIPA